jgi:hypothetical protein
MIARTAKEKTMDSELIERFQHFGVANKGQGMLLHADLFAQAAAAGIADNQRIAELEKALDIAWNHAQKMRNAAKLVGPYSNDPKATRIWARSLYHEGKELMTKLKPYRDALARLSAEGGE